MEYEFYIHLFEDTKPKGKIKRVLYWLWKNTARISPSKMFGYIWRYHFLNSETKQSPPPQK